MSYTAIISRISTRPHPNADRLLLGTVVGGNQVVVSTATQSGQLGIFFPTDGQLSEGMCKANSLYTKGACAKLGLDPVLYGGGFFDLNRRVRAQTFRGERSDGLWVPLHYLEWAGSTWNLVEGDQLTEFGGQPICNKYMTKATQHATKASRQGKRGATPMFPKQIDTAQYRFYSDAIPPDAIVYITEKLHGTSGRYGLVLDEIALPTWKQQLNRLWPIFPTRQWRYLNGSRNVILEQTDGAGYYGTNDFRYTAVEGLQLRKGETIYFELVGWVGDALIMGAQNVVGSGLDQAFVDRWPAVMSYTYGCPQGTTRLYVYRIQQANEDGAAVELSWMQVVQRCGELGLKTVPELDRHEGAYITKEYVTFLAQGPSSLDERHIREGVVLRIESDRGTQWLKHKSFEFGVLEGYLKVKDEYVDREEIA